MDWEREMQRFDLKKSLLKFLLNWNRKENIMAGEREEVEEMIFRFSS